MSKDQLVCGDQYWRCLKLGQLSCAKFQNFAMTCPSKEGLNQSLEQLSDGVETHRGEISRWLFKMCDCNHPVTDQPVLDFIQTQEEVVYISS